MHETGHNLGLKHGHVTQNGHGVAFPMLPADHNSYEYSVMTYSQFPGDTPGAPMNVDNAPNHPTTFMQDDIAAIQCFYGANYGATAHNTDTTYSWSSTTGQEFIDGAGQGTPDNNFVLMTLWDGGGIDTYDLSNYTPISRSTLTRGNGLSSTPTRVAACFSAPISALTDSWRQYVFCPRQFANVLLDPRALATETRSLIENANGGSGGDTLMGQYRQCLRRQRWQRHDRWPNGNDTAVYSGAKANYITTQMGSSIRIFDGRAGSPDGTDTNTNIEFFRFSDGIYTAAEVLNQPPVLSADTGSPHFLDEIFDVSNSATADAVSGTLAFTDPDSGDTHTASRGLFSATGLVV